MAVKIIRFSEPVNASEVTARAKCKTALEALGDSVFWIVFAGLASSSSPLHQSDDLDLVPIGPRGVFLIETKHWNAAWINDNRASAEAEAEKLTAKAKRLSWTWLHPRTHLRQRSHLPCPMLGGCRCQSVYSRHAARLIGRDDSDQPVLQTVHVTARGMERLTYARI